MNPNQRQPGESYDFFITRRKEWQMVEKMMDHPSHVRVLWDSHRQGAYIRAKHGPLTGTTPREMKLHERRQHAKQIAAA